MCECACDGAFAIGCGGTELRGVMVMGIGATRPDSCPLQLVSVDQTNRSETWQMLGSVSVGGDRLDPRSPEV